MSRHSATGRLPLKAPRAATAGLRPIFNDADVLGPIAGGFTVLRADFVKKHPDAARIFVVESARALDYARDNPEKSARDYGQNPQGSRREPGSCTVFYRLRGCVKVGWQSRTMCSSGWIFSNATALSKKVS
ncbi:Uncharacterised protein [Kluyvera cryocrescens]|uniref:Uncharacterized protein n=1 Tax=Kluyvera cryocrescens TaxID=580 RepID=A0A485ASY8_KLUCR|nr:Uncharacterised protein [Kluyvera cryocrescens]